MVKSADATQTRPVPVTRRPDGSPAGPDTFERGGHLVHVDRRLSTVLHRRPAGITGNQWSSALRTRLDYVVHETGGGPALAGIRFEDPGRREADASRTDRMTGTVCAAAGFGLVRFESAALPPVARRIVEYVLDARAFQRATADPAGDPPEGLPGFRDILGRLPDGRTGHVNDLGALARAAAVEAYAGRQLTDPIIRDLHVRWTDGPAEGWAWVEVRAGLSVFERVRVWQHGFSCGVDPGRFAADLAVMAVGERLKNLSTVEPELVARSALARELDGLHRRHADLAEPFAFAHVTFD
ncbi:hypothetical protein [Polymorphospora sp. NPDC050346]|uniref:hypothetical protein n=1 Tax=Polymorphospora sp. NPDC050346 TaxID=3155780 RepID=UPI0033D80D0B